MNVGEIKEKAAGLGIKPGKMKKEDLIRSIQEKEGFSPCYNTGVRSSCGQGECLWKGDCR